MFFYSYFNTKLDLKKQLEVEISILSIEWCGTAFFVGTKKAYFFFDPETGKLRPLSQVQLTSEVRRYVTNPWLANHVLAVRAAGGLTLGQNDFFGNYTLGGSIGDSGFQVTPDEFRMVRGYPYAVDVGDLYWLGSAEYRFPLARIERGLGTLPFYARTLSGALYLDCLLYTSPSPRD